MGRWAPEHHQVLGRRPQPPQSPAHWQQALRSMLCLHACVRAPASGAFLWVRLSVLSGSAVRAVVINPGSRGGDFISGENKAWQGERAAGEEAAHSPADNRRESGWGQPAVEGGRAKHRQPLMKGRMEDPVRLCK